MTSIPNVDVAVGARIVRLRIDRGVSREQLSQSVSITEAELSIYEAGDARVPAETLLRLADILAVPVSSFFQDDVLP